MHKLVVLNEPFLIRLVQFNTVRNFLPESHSPSDKSAVGHEYHPDMFLITGLFVSIPMICNDDQLLLRGSVKKRLFYFALFKCSSHSENIRWNGR